MLPPPRRPQTNADFRKLLDTPRVDRGGDEPKERRPRKQADAPKPKKKSVRPKPEAEKPEDDGYRQVLPCRTAPPTLFSLISHHTVVPTVRNYDALTIISRGTQHLPSRRTEACTHPPELLP
jgi:hypothetical protein